MTGRHTLFATTSPAALALARDELRAMLRPRLVLRLKLHDLDEAKRVLRAGGKVDSAEIIAGMKTEALRDLEEIRNGR